MPEWCIHRRVAEVLGIDIEVAKDVDGVIDLRKPHDGRSELGAFADKLLEILEKYGNDGRIFDALMAFHLHHILDLLPREAPIEEKDIEDAIEEYGGLLEDFMNKSNFLLELVKERPGIEDFFVVMRDSTDTEGLELNKIETLKNAEQLITKTLEEVKKRIHKEIVKIVRILNQ